MHVLFVHPNFPAQFRYIAAHLACDYGWGVSFASASAAAPVIRGVEKVVYRQHGEATGANNVCTRSFENCVAHAWGVYDALRRRTDLRPDLVVAQEPKTGTSLISQAGREISDVPLPLSPLPLSHDSHATKSLPAAACASRVRRPVRLVFSSIASRVALC
jgi:hypothetical protein